MRGRRKEVANLASPSRQDLQLQEHRSESVVLLPSPPSLWRQLAGRTGAELTLSERQLVPPSLPPLSCLWPTTSPGPPHGSLPVLAAVFWTHSVQMPLIWSPLSQHQHHSAVIHQPGGNVGCQPIRCRDSQKAANHRHALTPSDRQRG